jgi:hypothetical protein
VTDYTQIPEKPKEGGGRISPSSINPIMTSIEEDVSKRIGALEGQYEGEELAAKIQELKVNVLGEYTDLYGDEETITKIVDQIFGRGGYIPETPVTAPETAPAAPVEPTVGTGSPEPQTPAVAPPTGPEINAPLTEPQFTVIEVGDGQGGVKRLTLVRDNKDGSSTYMDEDGNEYDLENSKVRQSYSQ